MSRVYFLVLYFQSAFACILCKKSVNPNKDCHFVRQYLKINSKITDLLVVFLKIGVLYDVMPRTIVKFYPQFGKKIDAAVLMPRKMVKFYLQFEKKR